MRIATAALILLVTWGLTTHGKYSVTGDEPHYLMVAQSLRADGDIDVANNYARGDGALFGASGVQPELHVRRTTSGRTLPVHDLGVPLILLPVYTAATAFSKIPDEGLLRRFRMNRGLFTYSLMSLALIVLCSIAAFITMRALEDSGATRAAAASVVAIAWLSPPVLSNAFLIFPEPFALFVTACAVARCAPRDRSWDWRDWSLIAMLGAIPWLHRKFAFYAVALFCVVLWRRAPVVRSLPIRAKLLMAIVFGILPLTLAVWTYSEWGNLAGPLALDRLPFSMSAFAHGAVGTVLDRENGLIWWAPVYALLPAAFWTRRQELWPWLLPVFALTIPNAAHDQWWGGFSPAGRFLVPLAPIFCLIGAELVRRASLRVAAIALLVPQIIVTAYSWQHARLFWPQGDGENRVLAILLPPLGRAYRAIPSFRTAADASWPFAIALLALIVGLNVALVLAARPRSQI
ncbi:MAG TPA: hypothetical protein VEL51_18225 [Vicinamibacterales bacterium]|nr:hypothetical protein [Vicinamibacterales bacterium]